MTEQDMFNPEKHKVFYVDRKTGKILKEKSLIDAMNSDLDIVSIDDSITIVICGNNVKSEQLLMIPTQFGYYEISIQSPTQINTSVMK